MSQVDKGLVHAWLDGQLSPDEAARVERLVATDPAWGAAAADARGLLAGASRVLGALDGVPAALPAGGRSGELGGRAGDRGRGRVGSRMSIWRMPLVRVAAGIVIVAGVGGLLWQRMPQRASNVAAVHPVTSDSVGVAPPVVAAAPPAVQRELQSPRRNESVSPPNSPGAAVADAELRQQTDKASASGRGEARVALSGGLRAPAAAQPPQPAGVAQGAAAPANLAAKVSSAIRDERADPAQTTALMAPQIASLHLDDCWALTDSAGRVLERDGMVLRFIPPIASDAGAGAPPPARPQAPLPRQFAAKEQVAPAGATFMNAVVSQRADSTFMSTWFTDRGTTTAMFTVQSDTLRGTTRLRAGDIAYPLQPLRAVRVACPPAR